MNLNQLVLVEQNQSAFIRSLFQPIKNYVRIKYTNFAVNSRYLICGASSGGLYLFRRTQDEPKFLFTIPGNNGKISSIVFSRNNPDLFAFGTSRGVFKLILLKLSSPDGQQWQEIYLAKGFTKFSIHLIAFQDDDLSEFRLFLADEGFNVYMISRMKTFSSIIFKSEPPVRILSFDFSIHQLETDKQYLLVSADDKSSIFNMEKISLNRVGTKARPSGVFGSCFYSKNESGHSSSFEEDVKFVFTARPSLRLWQANLEGNVICTHQFKDYLNKSSCNFIYRFKDADHRDDQLRSNINTVKSKTQLTNSNFNQIYKLHVKGFTYLVTFTNVPRPMLFIINPLNAQIVFWTNQLNAITNILICDDQLIICHRNESNEASSESSTENTNTGSDRLFTLIKVFDLEDFLENENYLLRLSNLSLFCFLKENQLLTSGLIRDDLILRSHVDNEWFKLEDDLKPIFSDIRDSIDNKPGRTENNNCLDTQNSNLSSTSYETNESTSTANSFEQASSPTNGLSDGEIDFNIGQEEVTAVRSNGLAGLNSEANTGLSSEANGGLSSESNGSAETLSSEQQNGQPKKSIEELTSKHRWKKLPDEPVDERKVWRKKLNALKQCVDGDQIGSLKCKCGHPAPRAHQMMSGKQKEIRLLLIKLLDDTNLDETLDTCFELAIWNLYLDLLIIKRRYVDYIRTSLLLMDINLLSKNNLFIRIFRSDLSLAKQLLGQFIRQKQLDQDPPPPNESTNKAICLHCGVGLESDYCKWPDMVDFLYKNLQLNDLLNLLTLHHRHLPTSVLSPKLCIHLLQTEIIKQYENPMTNEELAKLNEKLAKIKKSTRTTKTGQRTNEWSMLLDLKQKNCDICTKSLRDCREPLLVFKCGHVYHKDCDETSTLSCRKACYVCSINCKSIVDKQ